MKKKNYNNPVFSFNNISIITNCFFCDVSNTINTNIFV